MNQTSHVDVASGSHPASLPGGGALYDSVTAMPRVFRA